MKVKIAQDGKYLSNPDHSIMGAVLYLPDSVDESQFTEIAESTFKRYNKEK